MTREEAISELQPCVDTWDKWMLPGSPSLNRYKEAVRMALAALRGPTREQVEKVWKGKWINKHSAYDYKIFTCAQCGKQISIQGENLDFCPKCGSTQTDEAVDIVMKRLEELYGKAETD